MDVVQDKILLGLLPCYGRYKYLIPDFEVLTKEYMATRPGSEERQTVIQNKTAITGAIYDVCLFHNFLHNLNYFCAFSTQRSCVVGDTLKQAKNVSRQKMLP